MKVEVVRLPGAGDGWYSVSEDDTTLRLHVEPSMTDDWVELLSQYAVLVEACLRHDPSLRSARGSYIPLPRMTPPGSAADRWEEGATPP
jgi:hypothetical protein